MIDFAADLTSINCAIFACALKEPDIELKPIEKMAIREDEAEMSPKRQTGEGVIYGTGNSDYEAYRSLEDCFDDFPSPNCGGARQGWEFILTKSHLPFITMTMILSQSKAKKANHNIW